MMTVEESDRLWAAIRRDAMVQSVQCDAFQRQLLFAHAQGLLQGILADAGIHAVLPPPGSESTMVCSPRQGGDEIETGVSQIEVTPEMIEAGARILEDNYNASPSEAADTATRVFLAMTSTLRG